MGSKDKNKRPSKYHRNVYTGSGHEWSWDSTHEELEPTSTFEVGNTYYCSYCGEKAFPIQALIKSHGDYDITGYCCVCKVAEMEKEFRVKLLKLREDNEQKVQRLQDRYYQKLIIDKESRLKKEYEYNLKHLDSMYEDEE